MAPFFRLHGHEGWHAHDGRGRWDRWHGHAEPGQGPPGGPDMLQSVVSAATAPITAPLKALGGLFGLEVEDPFPTDEEAELYPSPYGRRRSVSYKSGENSGSGDEFAPTGEETGMPRRTGRWIRRHGAIILFGV
jgi:hypothetical protein